MIKVFKTSKMSTLFLSSKMCVCGGLGNVSSLLKNVLYFVKDEIVFFCMLIYRKTDQKLNLGLDTSKCIQFSYTQVNYKSNYIFTKYLFPTRIIFFYIVFCIEFFKFCKRSFKREHSDKFKCIILYVVKQ